MLRAALRGTRMFAPMRRNASVVAFASAVAVGGGAASHPNVSDTLRDAVHKTELQGRRLWWQATRDPESRTMTAIIGTNVVIYGCWKVGNLPFMLRHFTCSVGAVARGRLHTMVTSMFSQMGIIHLGLNMYPLYSFGTFLMRGIDSPARYMFGWQDQRVLNATQFVYLYLLSGTLGSLTALLTALPRHLRSTFFLGASGSVMGILTLFCLFYPEAKLALFGMPITADQMLLLLLGVNGVGTAVSLVRHTAISFSGHLGGMLGGYLFYVQTLRYQGSHGWWNSPAGSALLDAIDPTVWERSWRRVMRWYTGEESRKDEGDE